VASEGIIARLVDRLSKLRPGDVSAVEKKTEAVRVPGASAAVKEQPQHAGDETGTDYDFLAPPQAADELGRLGPYRVLEVLGAGGMGVVFRAEDPHLQRLVALKAMLPGLAASGSAKQRFLREARAAAAIKHDHIVTIHQVGEDRGAPFLAMEYLEGEPLDERLKRESKLPLAEVLRIGRELAEGLAAAHERGLIHRDIKPANVWLEGKKGRVKILDFGLARAVGQENQLTQQRAIIGTPAYMAPEQARGKSVDQRCDLFSLGCVLYRMATSEPPFGGTDMISTLMAVAVENPQPPHDQDATLPPALSELIMGLLAKDPEDRPASAQAVAETLDRISRELAAGPAAVQTKAGTPEQTTKAQPVGRGHSRRRIAIAMAVALALLVPLGYWLGTVIIRVTTDKGTLVIESEDPTVAVTITAKGGATVRYGVDVKEIRLKPGEYGIELIDAKDGLKLSAKEFTITRGDRLPIQVRWEKKDDTVPKEGTHPPPFRNSLGMEFVLVPKGKSWLGGGGGKPGDKEVIIREDFYLGKYEVTQEEWQKITGANPSHFSREGLGKHAVKDIPDADLKRFPVEGVSWDDIQSFVESLNAGVKEAGWIYRLPKQAEWEYACRGGPLADRFESAFDFYCEKPTNQLQPDQANILPKGRTCKVGSYKPNRLGLHDMHGNVWEWCDDLFDPKDPAKASLRVIRGGCWIDTSGNCRTANRHATAPSVRSHFFGVRVARVPVGKEIVKVPPEE